MGNRYFLLIFLPTLSFDRQPELSQEEVNFFLQQNLSFHEWNVVRDLYRLYDIENIRAYFLGVPMTAPGLFSHDELIEKLTEGESIPEAEAFFRKYPTTEEKKRHIHELRKYFLRYFQPSHPFLRKYFHFELHLRHILAWLRARITHKMYQVSQEELHFDITNLKTWPEWFVPLANLWQQGKHHPREIEETLARWKFSTIGNFCEESPPFSLDFILAYLIQLRILETRQELENPHHLTTLQRIVKAVSQ